jgi:UDP-N-acetylmuramate dehydrogenase
LDIRNNVSLQKLNSFGITARARRFASPAGLDELVTLLKRPGIAQERKLVLGGGSNVLLTGNVDALVLQYRESGVDVVRESDRHVWVRTGAGHNWHDLVLRMIDSGLAGLENLSLIPGNVGAAPIQNIGAYGMELSELFESLDAVELDSGEIHTYSKSECDFGYRDSIFKNSKKGKYIITDVTLRLNREPEFRLDYGDIRKTLEEMNVQSPDIRNVSDAVCRIRRSKLPDPEKLGNAGSFFKNPVIEEARYKRLREAYPGIPGYASGPGLMKVPAGWLIEKAGWKGRRIGDAGSHEKQALVLVNYGKASGNDILALAEQIAADVTARFGIILTPEVNIWHS